MAKVNILFIIFLFYLFCPFMPPLEADSTPTPPSAILSLDTFGEAGTGNVGDFMRVDIYFPLASTPWTISPRIDLQHLSGTGTGNTPMEENGSQLRWKLEFPINDNTYSSGKLDFDQNPTFLRIICQDATESSQQEYFFSTGISHDAHTTQFASGYPQVADANHIIGSTLTITGTRNNGTGDDDGLTVTADLSGVGFGTAEVLTHQGAGVYTLSKAITSGNVDTTGVTFPVTMTDNDGNTISKNTSNAVGVDNQRPTVSSVNVAVSGDGDGYAEQGETITITANVTPADGGAASISFSLSDSNWAAASMTMDDVSGNGTQFRAIINLTNIGTLDDVTTNYTVTVEDNAGNQGTFTGSIKVDDVPPVINGAFVHINPDRNSNSILDINDGASRDIASITVNLDKAIVAGSGAGVFVDLSPLGGSTSTKLTQKGSTASYRTDFVVIKGTTDDPNVTFPFTAIDNAGQSDSEAVTGISVDNQPPAISAAAASVQNDLNNDGKLNPNETLRITATVTEADQGGAPATITVDLSPINGPTAFGLPNAGGNTYQGDYPVPLASNIEGTFSFVVTAKDNAGNFVKYTTANSITVDTRGPVITNVVLGFTNTGDKNGNKIANEGDTVFVRATVTGNDSNKPQANFLNLGDGLVNMNDDGNSEDLAANDGIFGATLLVPNGSNDIAFNVASIPVRATDSGGNTAEAWSATSPIFGIDNQPPVILGASAVINNVAKISNNPAAIVNVGDTVSFSVSINDFPEGLIPNSAQRATPTVEIFNIRPDGIEGPAGSANTNNGNAASTVFWLFNDGKPEHGDSFANDNVWSVIATATLSLVQDIDLTNASFTVTVTDRVSGETVNHIATASTNGINIDIHPPAVTTPVLTIETHNYKGSDAIAAIGEQVKVSADITDLDGGLVTAIFSSFGALSPVTMSLVSGNNYAASFTIATGSIFNLVPASVTVVAIDNAQNPAYSSFNDSTGIGTQPSSNLVNLDNVPPNGVASLGLILDRNNNGIADCGSNTVNLADTIRVQYIPDGSSTLNINPNEIRIQGNFIATSANNLLLTGGAAVYRTNPDIDLLNARQFENINLKIDINLEDAAGNRNVIVASRTFPSQPGPLYIDTDRPELLSATFNNVYLNLTFDQPVDLTPLGNFILETIRLGDSNNLNSGNYVDLLLSRGDKLINSGGVDEATVQIELGSGTKQLINAFSASNFFCSFPSNKFLGNDINGNRIVPIEYATAFTVTSTLDTTPPNLTGGNLDANDPANILTLTFNETMQASTLQDSTVSALILRLNNGSDYTLYVGSDTISGLAVPNGDGTSMKIAMSAEAMLKIKEGMGNAVTIMRAYIKTSPVLIRDMGGNAITPLNTSQMVNITYVPDITKPMLLYGAPDRPFLNANTGILTLTFNEKMKKSSINQAGITIYEKAAGSIPTGDSFNLSSSDQLETTNENASTTYTIKLNAISKNRVIAWEGIGPFYLGLNSNVMADLSGNFNELIDNFNRVKLYYASETVSSIPFIVNFTTTPDHPFNDKAIDQVTFKLQFSESMSTRTSDRPTVNYYLPGSTATGTTNFKSWTQTVHANDTLSVTNAIAISTPSPVEGIASLTIQGAKDLEDNTMVGDFASAPFNFDNKAPVLAGADPGGGETVNTRAAGDLIKIGFSEKMNTGIPLTVSLTGSNNTPLAIAYVGWEAGGSTATYKFSSGIDQNTPQGNAQYRVSGGRDVAGNNMSPDPDVSQFFVVRTQGPNLTTLKDPVILSGFKEYSINVPPASISFEAQGAAGQNLYIQIQDANNSGGSIASQPFPETSAGTYQYTWNGKFNDGSPVTSGNYKVFTHNGIDRGSLEKTFVVNNEISPTTAINIEQNGAVVNGPPTPVVISTAVSGAATLNATGISASEIITASLTASLNTGNSIELLMTYNSGVGAFQATFNGTGGAGYISGSETFIIHLRDDAGNLASLAADISKIASYAFVLDNEAPSVSSIQLTPNPYNGSEPLSISYSYNVGATDFNNDRFFIFDGNGSEIIRENTPLGALGTTLSAVIANTPGPRVATWTGLVASNSSSVDPGNYTVRILDQAGNQSVISANLTIVSSQFAMQAATQFDQSSFEVTFSQDVDFSTVANTDFNLSSSSGIAFSGATPVRLSATRIRFFVNRNFNNGETVSFSKANTGVVKDIYSNELLAGQVQFSADGVGPQIASINFNGFTEAKQIRVVFSEEVNSSDAKDLNKYSVVNTTNGVAIVLRTVELENTGTSVIINTQDLLKQNELYQITVVNIRDKFGNLSTSTSLTSPPLPDFVAPALTVAALSNPASEFQIMVAVKSDETLQDVPRVLITQSGGSAQLVPMTKINNTTTEFIGGASMDPNYPGVAAIDVSATDLNGNAGTASTNFVTARINAKIALNLKFSEAGVNLKIPSNSIDKETMITMLKYPLSGSKSNNSSAYHLSSSINLKKLGINEVSGEGPLSAELVPLTNFISLAPNNLLLKKKATIGFKKMSDSELERRGIKPHQVALYKMKANGWEFVGRELSQHEIQAKITSGGIYTLLADIKAPQLIPDFPPEDEEISDRRPVFKANIKEEGSGIDLQQTVLYLDGRTEGFAYKPAEGELKFQPAEKLDGGYHRIKIQTRDRAGNQAITAEGRFFIQLPLQLLELIPFPNPARRKASIRYRLTREIDSELVKVKIYDSTGDLVREMTGVDRFKVENGSYIYDIPWDLRNEEGSKVANGVYFARFKLNHPERSYKRTLKLAVLR
ncbi:FlgD immunoglobulin-like domain containing protein [Candidatus Riflebacteria bacterium]